MSAARIAAGFIAPFEGFRAQIYRDSVGVRTIGYGETDTALLAKYAQGISEPVARQLLADRVREFGRQVDRVVSVPLSDRQRAALYSFAYNLGGGALVSSTLLKLLNQRHYARAANEFPKWDRAGGLELAGLKRRRLAERDLFLKGSNRGTRIVARATFHG